MNGSSGSVSFQFHKGAIRTAVSGVDVPTTPVFQFHKGAIRTQELQHLHFSQYAFQFHKGAIRTTSVSSDSPRFDYLNSIKVRLEPFKNHFCLIGT